MILNKNFVFSIFESCDYCQKNSCQNSSSYQNVLFWNRHFRYTHTQIIAENWFLKCNSVKLSFCKNRDCQIFKKNYVNPLNDNPTKWWKTLKQFVDKLPTNFLSVFEHFVGLAFKRLMNECRISIHKP